MEDKIEQPQLQQIVCATCQSLKHQLIGVTTHIDNVEFSILCLNCGQIAMLNFKPNQPLKKEKKAVSYAG